MTETDLRTKTVARIIEAAGIAAGIVILVGFILATLAVGGVWGPGWLGDFVDWLVG